MTTLSIIIVAVFCLGYFFIAIESVTKINKAAIALLMFVLCWTLFMIDPSQYIPGIAVSGKALAFGQHCHHAVFSDGSHDHSGAR